MTNKILYVLLIAVVLFCGPQKSYALTKIGPSVIEIVYPGGKVEQEKLLRLCKQQMVDVKDIYQWKNHFVVFGIGYGRFYKASKMQFTDCSVRVYTPPFYDFERTRCSDKRIAKEWDNIILTANLVADPKKQQEYLNYHKTQFEKWPEVSQGFCNASFQRLLVYRNGRQLMLVISIPKGESLDKLNPLTTKDNPRVDEWNKIMAKYQEGIPETKPGETWVFLKPL